MSINVDKLVAALQDSDGQAVVVFHNSLLNSRFALKSGKECIFLNGDFATGNPEEVREIAEDINAGNPHISLSNDFDKVLINKADLDPLEALKRKIIADFVATQATIVEGKADYGTSEQGKLNATSSTDVNAAASGSISGAAAPAGVGAKIVVGPRN